MGRRKPDKKLLIKIFNKVRDMPCIMSGRYPFACHQKACLLQSELEKVKIKSHLVVVETSWQDLPLPPKLKKMAPKRCNHVILEVETENKETNHVFVDPTWDWKLHQYLPVAVWDGQKSTSLAFPQRGVAQRLSRFSSLRTLIWEFFFPDDNEFYQAFDHWLDSIRVEGI